MMYIKSFNFIIYLSLACLVHNSCINGSEKIAPFKDIPFADKQGIVLSSRILPIKGINNPYNASIIKVDEDTFLIFFRIRRSRLNYFGAAAFDVNFIQKEDAILYNEKKAKHEQDNQDPRAFYYDNKIHCMVSHTVDSSKNPYINRPNLFSITEDGKSLDLGVLNYGLKAYEKNWTPFIYVDSTKAEHLMFIYEYNPLKIIEIDKSNSIQEIIVSNQKKSFLTNGWEKKWGKISGGAPAILIGDEYISFFHSHFKFNGTVYYCLGALTFEAKYPFDLKRISRYPIIAKEFYSTPVWSGAFYKQGQIYNIFCCGAILERRNDKEIFYLTCGENDSAIRLVEIDKEMLLESMDSIHS